MPGIDGRRPQIRHRWGRTSDMVMFRMAMEPAMKRAALVFSLLLGFAAATPAALAHEDDASPKQLGEVAFANSCAPEVQESFERGVALLHSFGFTEGEQAFRQALDLH